MATTKKAAAKKDATAAPKKAAPKKRAPAKKPAKDGVSAPNPADGTTTTSGAPIPEEKTAEKIQEEQNKLAEEAAKGEQRKQKTLASKDAFDKLNAGKTIRRAGWAKGEQLESEDGNIYRNFGNGRRDLYNSSAEDAGAEDWHVG